MKLVVSLGAGLGLRILFCDVEKWKIKNVENKLFLANDEMLK